MTRATVLLVAVGILGTAPAHAVTGRYVGSFQQVEGDRDSRVLSQLYEMRTFASTPGDWDLDFRMNLNHRVRPGDNDTGILSSRFNSTLRANLWRLNAQFVPWQDQRPGNDSPRQRNLSLRLDVSPRRGPQLQAAFNRRDRTGDLGRSSSEDRRLELTHRVLGLGTSLSYRNVETQPADEGLGAPRRTEDVRGTVNGSRAWKTLTGQATYAGSYSRFRSRERDRQLASHRVSLTSSWQALPTLSLAAAINARESNTEDSQAPREDLDERGISGHATYRPFTGLALVATREYRKLQRSGPDQVSDFLQLSGSLQRRLIRNLNLRVGHRETVDLQSRGATVPSNSSFTALEGTLRRGISGRLEVQRSTTGGEIATGTQWRRLAQIRTRPRREIQADVSWRRDTLPRLEGLAQSDEEWTLALGVQPNVGPTVRGSYRWLDGSGRLDREDRVGRLTVNWSTGERTSITFNGSRRTSRNGALQSSQSSAGVDLDFWLNRGIRTKTSANWTSLDGRSRTRSYNVSVEKKF